MNMAPDVTAFATRRLLRQLYIEQLSSARVSPFVPPADATDVPIVVLVGYEAVGKGNSNYPTLPKTRQLINRKQVSI